MTRVQGHSRIPAGAVHGARIANALLGTVTVALVGLLALEGLGPLAALIALALAAVYPVFIGLSGTIVAENLTTPLVLASIWAALVAARSSRPYWWTAAAGLLAGFATLSHVNAIVLVVPLILILWRVRPAPAVSRWRSLLSPGIAVGCLLLALTPWLVRDAVVMHRFVFVTDETGITLVGTYNSASAAYGPVPYKWRLYTGIPAEAALAGRAATLSETALSDRLLSHARHYITSHPSAPFEVTFDNSRRLLELEGSYAWHASAEAISLPRGMARLGVFSFWLLCMLALAGALTRAGRAAWRWLWVTPVLLWLSVALVNAETPRFREPVDPFLVVLAACALAAGVRRLQARLHRAPVAGTGVGALSAGASKRVEVV